MIHIAPRTLEEVCDVIAVTQLAAAYAESVSRGAVAEACETYAVDGELHSPTTTPAIGRAAVEATIARTCSSLEFVFQTVHQGIVEVRGDTARARFPITEWARRDPSSRALQFLGFYDDECVRTDKGWRFARRTLTPRLLGRPEGFGWHPAASRQPPGLVTVTTARGSFGHQTVLGTCDAVWDPRSMRRR